MRGARSIAVAARIELDDSVLLRERPRSKPHPSIMVRTALVDGTEVDAIWAWLDDTRRAKLVTVYFGND